MLVLSIDLNGQANPYQKIIDHVELEDHPSVALETASQQVVDQIVTDDGKDFNILSYDLYPILAYVDASLGYPHAHNMAKDDLKTNYDNHHLAIVKEYRSYSEENSLHSENVTTAAVYLKLPDTGQFDDVSSIDIMALRERMENLINSELENGSSMVVAEEKAMLQFNTDLALLLNGGTLDNNWEEAGFTRYKLSEINNVFRTGEDVVINGGNINVVNKEGYHFNDVELASAFNSSDPQNPYSYSIFFTGKELESSGGISTVFDQFENDGSKIKVWIHFDFETIIDDPSLKTNNKGDNRNGEDKYMYVKSDNNLTLEESKEQLNASYEEHYNKTKNALSEGESFPSKNCSISWEWGKNCIYQSIKEDPSSVGLGLTGFSVSTEAAFLAGLVDGLLGTIRFFWDSANFLESLISAENAIVVSYLTNPATIGAGLVRIFKHETTKKVLRTLISGDTRFMGESVHNAHKVILKVLGDFSSMNYDELKTSVKLLVDAIRQHLPKEFVGSLSDFVGYQSGVLAFDIVLAALTTGTTAVLNISKIGVKLMDWLTEVWKNVDNILDFTRNIQGKFLTQLGKKGPRVTKCSIIRGGCFVKDTPVLLAGGINKFNLRNSSKAVAVAAAIPIVTVPIQDVQLLDYVVAHETVNSTYGLMANVGDDETYFLDKDSYTSDEQRERDKYELDDKNWNAVVFEEVYGGSTAKLALHNDWISEKGYRVNVVVELRLPEQGISGPFKITSIKHIIPQKKPIDDDETDEYDYRPVTALFTHESNQVYNVSFDNGEQLGVTYQHPIYSTTAGDWKLVGELEIGEEVLTKSGTTKMVSSTKKGGSETMYNLEIKELHNFLVGKSGIVVHNACKKADVKKLLDNPSQIDELADELPSKTALQELKQMKNSGDPDFDKLMDDLDEIPLELGEGLVKSWKAISALPRKFKTVDNLKAIDGFEKINPGSLNAIENIVNTIKTSRRQPFLNALKHVSNNNVLGQSLTKSRIATADEIKDALNKIRDYRSGVPSGGNYGYLEGNVTGVTIDNSKMWRSVSLEDAQGEIHIFDAIEAPGSTGSWERITDSEYRMLNKLADDLGAQSGNVYSGVTGSVKIVSENPYCKSCQGVIKQFNDMFPNVEIILIDGVK